MKRNLLHTFFLMLFIGSVSLAGINYLWCSDTSFQIIEEEIGSHDTPLSKKNFCADEEILSNWLSEFIATQIRFDHGVEILTADHVLVDYSVPFAIESPPPDQA